MASIEELSNALINADKAGDTVAARSLAAEIVKMRGQTQAAPAAAGEVAQPESQASIDARNEMSAITKAATGELPGGNLDAARYDALPEWKKPIIAAGDTLDLLGNGITFGYGDKAAAAGRSLFTGKPY